MTLIFAFWQGFLGPHELNYVAKNASILGPLVGFRRDVSLPYFGKQSVIWAYFPQEPKRGDYRGLPVLTGVPRREKEPVKGLYPLKIQTLIFPVSPTKNR